MQPNIPASLATYIQACLEYRASTLITSILSTPSTWLVLRVMYAAIYGASEDSSALGQYRGALKNNNNNNETRPVIFVSLLRPLSLWVEMGRKVGLDIPLLLKREGIVYIDGMSRDGGATPSSSGSTDISTLPTIKLKSLSLHDIQEAITTGSRTLTSTSTPTSTPNTLPRSTPSGTPTPRMPLPSSSSASRTSEPAATASSTMPLTTSTSSPLILIDGLDFILASQSSVTPTTLDLFLGSLRTLGHALVITGQADAPLLHPATTASGDGDVSVGGTTPLERDHAHFMTTQAHQCRWVWQLRGLDTGSAKDVTGVIRVSRGGSMDLDEEDEAGNIERLTDIERLYQLKGDGSVRTWSRGE